MTALTTRSHRGARKGKASRALPPTSSARASRRAFLLAAASLILLIPPRFRQDERLLIAASVMVFTSLWIDKGLGLIVGGFVPSPLGAVTRYVPTLPEMAITLSIWAVGLLMVTVFYKIALSVKADEEGLA